MSLLDKIKVTDLRSIGNSEQLVVEIGDSQKLFDEIFEGIKANDPNIRMICTDVVEKCTSKNKNLLLKHKKYLVDNLDKNVGKEIRWHMAQLLSYLPLEKNEVTRVVKVLQHWLDNDESRIVRVNSLQALADISVEHDYIRDNVVALIVNYESSEVPSLSARAKKLLKKICR